uniref:ComEA family DNA-binding protein n=1 Tax=Ezakiella massiliensis TaxID=1852374 RepID=UPI00094DFFD3|nr:ComEA family DNA-binding protein [Ezakiella massiliensis]
MKRLFILLLCFLFISCSNQEDLSEYDLKLNLNDNKSVDSVSDNENSKIFVHITGEVLRSGVYEMESGSRVIDLVNEAGGFTVDANQEAVNLAEKLRDGSKVYIPNKDDKVNIKSLSSSSSDSEVIVDLNTGSKEELMKLPSVGEKTADSIIKYREENEFKDFNDLLKVPGIGKKKLESFKGMISIGGNIYE